VRHPRPGTDAVGRAFEEGWVNDRTLAFQGLVAVGVNRFIAEVFVVELPADLTVVGTGPLEGTPVRRPDPPRGTAQRRLTFTADRPSPGLQGPRHWLRSDPAGTRVGFLMLDDADVVQFWTVPPTGGPPTQVTRNPTPVASAFTWHPDGKQVAFVRRVAAGGAFHNQVCVADVP
jgi:hypothetical protein